MNNFNLEGKNIIITGASSGIGREIANLCLKNGANVGLLGRNEDSLSDLVKSFNKGNNHFLACDLGEIDFEEKFISFLKHFNKIDGFVHSAGVELTKSLSITKSIDFIENFQLNVISGFMISKIISNRKYLNETASYVFISSVMSIVGQPGKVVYSSTKGALVSGARSMALELIPKNIRVNVISPGMVNTPMSNKMISKLSVESVEEIHKLHPLGIGSPLDVANAAYFLLTDASKWITGINLIVDGGYTLK